MGSKLVPVSRADDIAQALWYVAPGCAELREEKLTVPARGDVRVRAWYGALSRGTERLVPASEFERMRAPFMGGNFPFPVKYGYKTVGWVEAGPADLEGRVVFALHPHQNLFNVPSSCVVRLPNMFAAKPRRACGQYGNGSQRGLGRRARASRPYCYCWCRRRWRVGGIPLWAVAGAEVTLVDINPARAEIARKLGVDFATPERAPADCDLVFQASATASGLATALESCGERGDRGRLKLVRQGTD